MNWVAFLEKKYCWNKKKFMEKKGIYSLYNVQHLIKYIHLESSVSDDKNYQKWK